MSAQQHWGRKGGSAALVPVAGPARLGRTVAESQANGFAGGALPAAAARCCPLGSSQSGILITPSRAEPAEESSTVFLAVWLLSSDRC